MAHVLASQVEHVFRIARHVTFEQRIRVAADLNVVFRQLQVLLHVERRFDHRCCQAGRQVPEVG